MRLCDSLACFHANTEPEGVERLRQNGKACKDTLSCRGTPDHLVAGCNSFYRRKQGLLHNQASWHSEVVLGWLAVVK